MEYAALVYPWLLYCSVDCRCRRPVQYADHLHELIALPTVEAAVAGWIVIVLGASHYLLFDETCYTSSMPEAWGFHMVDAAGKRIHMQGGQTVGNTK